jgi:ATP-dependent exoDNAse (exonuclease V) beta subunit
MRVLQLKQLLGDNQQIIIQGTEQKPAAKSKACIARTNIKLLEKAINRLDDKKTVYYFEGGLNGYTFASQNASIYDVLNLYLDKKRLIRSELIRSFQAFENLEQYAKETLDAELDMVCQLVRKYKAELIDLLNELKNRQIENKDKATDIFSTVHKAKGMEYDIVTLTDDFTTESKIKAVVEKAQEQEQLYQRLRQMESEKSLGLDVKAIRIPANWRETLKEEINILYVAVTRTKSSLLVSEELFQYFTGKKSESQPPENKELTEKSTRKQSLEERLNQ